MTRNIKKLFIAFLVLFLFTGCTIDDISNKDLSKNIDLILSKKNKYYNADAIGYQYYLPNGVKQRKTNDFNAELTSNKMTYYLYADIVSYYYKVDNEYKLDEKAYLSKSLKNKNKKGYIEINEQNGKYYIEMMYNYAKIEALVNKNELTNAVSNISLILSSVKYNDNVIETLIGDKKYDLSESETYNIFKTKKKVEGNFLDYVNEYDNYEGEVENLIEKEEIEQDKE